MQFSGDPPIPSTFTQASKDSIDKGSANKNQTKYNMFMDDNLFAQTKDFIKHTMAASIEALYIVLVYPEISKRQDSLSLDKYFESVCLHKRIQLGIEINTRTMTVGLTENKRLSMLKELTH